MTEKIKPECVLKDYCELCQTNTQNCIKSIKDEIITSIKVGASMTTLMITVLGLLLAFHII